MGGFGGSMIGILARLITERAASTFVSQKSVSFMAKLTKEDLTVLRDLWGAVFRRQSQAH